MNLRIRDWDKHFENAASRKLKRLDWVPVPNKMDGSGYTALVDHPNAAAHLGAWYAILEVASKQTPKERRGELPGGNYHDIGGICRSLGRISRLPAAIFAEVIPRLLSKEIQWLEQFGDQVAESAGDSVCQIGTIARRAREAIHLPIAPPPARYPYKNSTSAESASTSAESASTSAESGGTGKGREGKGREEETPPTPSGEFDLTPPKELNAETPPDQPRVARPAVQTTPESADVSTQAGWFEEWWAIYWLHKARSGAAHAFRRRVKTEVRFQRVMAATKEQTPEMLSREPSKRPYGATWLNGERWEDEPAPPVVPVNGGAPSPSPRMDAVKQLAIRNLERTGQLL